MTGAKSGRGKRMLARFEATANKKWAEESAVGKWRAEQAYDRKPSLQPEGGLAEAPDFGPASGLVAFVSLPSLLFGKNMLRTRPVTAA